MVAGAVDNVKYNHVLSMFVGYKIVRHAGRAKGYRRISYVSLCVNVVLSVCSLSITIYHHSIPLYLYYLSQYYIRDLLIT